jgi:hypothetical protein
LTSFVPSQISKNETYSWVFSTTLSGCDLGHWLTSSLKDLFIFYSGVQVYSFALLTRLRFFCFEASDQYPQLSTCQICRKVVATVFITIITKMDQSQASTGFNNLLYARRNSNHHPYGLQTIAGLTPASG